MVATIRTLTRLLVIWVGCFSLPLWLLLQSGCRKAEEPVKREAVQFPAIENRKYRFTIRLHAYRLSIPGDPSPVTGIEHVTFQDADGGEEVRYVPPGEGPAGNPAFYFQAMISPDEETLVLPLGYFQGFGFIHAKTALADLKANRFFETVVVQMTQGTELWHDFEKWDGNQAIRFKAGQSGDMIPFRFDLSSKRVAPLRPEPPGTFVAITSKTANPVKP